MSPSAESTSWINPKLRLGPSKVEGMGYLAIESILKGERLIVQSGHCVSVAHIDASEMEPFWYYAFQIEKDIYYYPRIDQKIQELDGIFRINHSCEPNAGFTGLITLVAMRDIAVGEEITYDYAMTDIETPLEEAWEPEQCKCGSENCRKLITGNDWKQRELQEKYKNYFSTHVASAIASSTTESDTL